MNDIMCEKCKNKYGLAYLPPCVTCKYSFSRGTSRFDNSESFFEPENAEDAKREEIEFIDAMLETMGRDDVRAFCLCSAFQYLWPCNKKHETPTEDVEKALWYLKKYIELGGDL